MKIKLAILESDQSYLNRILLVFSTKYADKIQIYSFSSLEMAITAVVSEKIDVLIANDSFDVNTDELSHRCSFAYFVDSPDVETVKGQRAICKFQKAELIYKEILSIYSENAGSLAGLKLNDDSCSLITFSSPCGGTGTSTVAAACAMHFTSLGKRTLFLSYEDFGSADSLFTGEGQFTMSDVVFSLKSRKANLALKLESYVKQDPRGVYFFSASKFALDMLEFKHSERMQLLSELKMVGSYDYIILDNSFALDKDHLDLYKMSNHIVMVGDGSDSSNVKISRAFEALSTMEQSSELSLTGRIALIYNKFSNKTGRALDSGDIKVIGGAPIYTQATGAQIVGQLAPMGLFDKLD